ncbi:MAG: hypothetical protein V1750_01980 [Acidobacteriota bacterium]
MVLRLTFRAIRVAAIVMLLAPAALAQPKVEIEGRYWKSTLAADARVGNGELGTAFDFKDDLGMTDKNITDLRLIFNTGPRSRIRLGYLQVAYAGDASVSRTIEFSGQTYTVGTRVLSALDKKYGRLGWIWQFVNAGNGAFRLGTLLEVKQLAIEARLAANELQPPERASEKFDAMLPTIGLALDIVPHRGLDIFAELSGISAGSKGSMVDGEAGIKIVPVPSLAIIASYRVLELKYKDKPDYANLKISGPFAGLSLRF